MSASDQQASKYLNAAERICEMARDAHHNPFFAGTYLDVATRLILKAKGLTENQPPIRLPDADVQDAA